MYSAGRKLSIQEIKDLIEGAIVLGCGGGGDPQIARHRVKQVLSQDKEFFLLEADALNQEAWVCILGYVGGGVEPMEKSLAENLPRLWEDPIIQAAKELSQYMQIEFDAYLCSEIGAGNTIANFFVAAIEGKPVIDGDAVGKRAKPELCISLTNLMGIPPTPLAAATHYGDITILKQSPDEARAEQLCRYLARASAGRLAVARNPCQAKVMKKAICPGSISLAIQIGRIISENRYNTLDGIAEVLGAKKIFEGEVEKFSKEDKGGFVWGNIFIRGSHDYKGQKYRVYFKNENLLAWRDDVLDITCPDNIIMVDAESGKGMYNMGDQAQRGRKVAVLGVSAEEIWKTKRGLEVFGPRHFGFDLPYKPLAGD